MLNSHHSAALLHPHVSTPRPPDHEDVTNAFVAGGSCGGEEEGREGEWQKWGLETRRKFFKVLYLATLCSKYTRALFLCTKYSRALTF